MSSNQTNQEEVSRAPFCWRRKYFGVPLWLLIVIVLLVIALYLYNINLFATLGLCGPQQVYRFRSPPMAIPDFSAAEGVLRI